MGTSRSAIDDGNRRKSQRVRLVIQVESLATGASSIGRTDDISVGGLLMLTRDTFEPRTTVTIRFNLPPVPPSRPVECQGVVVHVEPGVHMGVEFLRLKDEDRKLSRNTLSKSLAPPEPPGVPPPPR